MISYVRRGTSYRSVFPPATPRTQGESYREAGIVVPPSTIYNPDIPCLRAIQAKGPSVRINS